MTNLSVNLNKVALLRNQRDVGVPNVIEAARVCMAAGARGITVHPRPDERHTRKSDVYALADIVDPPVEFNIEGNPFLGHFMEVVRDVKPTQATLVPDTPGASTSDHGWPLAESADRLRPIIAELRDLGTRVSLFMDADSPDIALAKELGADRIELYTEPYARGFAEGDAEAAVAPFIAGAERARAAGLGLNAGHDLNLDNLPLFIERVPGVLEVSIGHALIADALFMGLESAVRAYLAALGRA